MVHIYGSNIWFLRTLLVYGSFTWWRILLREIGVQDHLYIRKSSTLGVPLEGASYKHVGRFVLGGQYLGEDLPLRSGNTRRLHG